MHVEDKDLVATLSQQMDGASLTAAVYARVETALSPARWLGPLGNYLVARPAARSAAHEAGERTHIPLDAAVVLAVAARDLHVWQQTRCSVTSTTTLAASRWSGSPTCGRTPARAGGP